ncbi:trypsin-like serine peptidase [Streptomyces virginiae]|uniref:Trypsin-like peptidase domain-containing protein n=1 Tax=Streptomyces virginiae TaxID=1961 RepID=A0ABZ1T7D7_STRVG|nr:trypsin-like peptidase domain-containing protein [Streptomyces virginiae]
MDEQYWTAERVTQAKPIDAARGAGPKAPSAPNSPAAAPRDTPHAAYFDGLPMVGTFFFDGTPVGGNATYRTGSVVRSKGKSLVLTAGHCANGLNAATHRVFVPQYQFLKIPANQPWGLFAVGDVYKDDRYPNTGQTKAAESDLDFAFVTVAPNGKGAVEDVVGALTFTTSASYDHNVTVVGYPARAGDNSQHKAIRCDVPTRRLYGFRQMQMQMQMECGGYYGGVSGSPWIKDFTGSNQFDPMVRWDDGELSLFTNVSAGTMGQEYKLKDPNSTWKDATLLTAGQYSGGGRAPGVRDALPRQLPGRARSGRYGGRSGHARRGGDPAVGPP